MQTIDHPSALLSDLLLLYVFKWQQCFKEKLGAHQYVTGSQGILSRVNISMDIKRGN